MPTVTIANSKGAATVDENGQPLVFQPDQPQEVEAEHAALLLKIKDAGYYEPGVEVKPFDPNPGLSLIEEERRGKTRPSPYPKPDDPAEAKKVEDAEAELEAAEANLMVGDAGPAIPPRKGRGSSAAAWQDYARQLGYAIAEGASRDEIIAYLEARGIETEQRGGTATILGAYEGDETEETAQETPPAPEPVNSETDPETVNSEVAPAGEESAG
jgi:hypothetical protein